MPDILAELVAKITADASELKRELAGVERDIGETGKALDKETKSWQEQFKAVGKIALSMGASITSALTISIMSFTKIGSELHDLSLKTGISVEALAGLKYAAEQSGASLGGMEVALRKLSSFVTNAKDQQLEYDKALEEASINKTKLATQAIEENAKAIEENANKIQDLKDRKIELSKAIQTTTDRLAIANQKWQETTNAAAKMKKALPQSEIMQHNLTIGELNSNLANLQTEYNGIDSQVAKVTVSLGKSTGAIEESGQAIEKGAYLEALDKLKISINDLEGFNPEQIFLKLATAVAEVKDPMERAALAVDLFGRSGTDMLPMLSEGADGLRKMMEEGVKLTGWTDEGSKSADALGDAFGTLKTSTMGVFNAIGTALAPTLKDLADKIVVLVSKFVNWAKEHPNLVKQLGLLALAVGGFLTVAGTLMMLAPAIAAAWATAMGPVGWITAAIVGLIAIGILLWQNWDTISVWCVKIWNDIKNFFVGIWNSIVGVFQKAWDWLKENWPYFLGLPGLIIKNWDTIIVFFKNIWEKVVGVFKDAWEFIKNLFIKYHPVGMVISHWEKIKDFFSDLWEKVTNIFKDWWDKIVKFIKQWNPWEIMKRAWDAVKDGIKGILKSIFGGSIVEDWIKALKRYFEFQNLYPSGEQMMETLEKAIAGKLDDITWLTKKQIEDLKLWLAEQELPFPQITQPVTTIKPMAAEEYQTTLTRIQKPGERFGSEAEAIAFYKAAYAESGMIWEPHKGVIGLTPERKIWALETVQLEVQRAIEQGLTGLLSTSYQQLLTLAETATGAQAVAIQEALIELGEASRGFGEEIIPAQHGGIFTRPTLARIGEAGAEAVIPLNETGGLGNITINFTQPVFFDREDSLNRFVEIIRKGIQRQDRLKFGGAYNG